MRLPCGACIGLTRSIGLAGQCGVSQLPFREIVGRFDLRVEHEYEQLFLDHQPHQFVDEIAKIVFCGRFRLREVGRDVEPVGMADVTEPSLEFPHADFPALVAQTRVV